MAEQLIISGARGLLPSLFSVVSNAIINAKKSTKVTVLVMHGKSTFMQNFKTEFATSTDLYVIDIEAEILKDVANIGLIDLKAKDTLIYESKLFPLCVDYLEDVKTHLLNLKLKKHIIVLCSSKNMKKALGVKKSFYYLPIKSLFIQIESKIDPKFKTYINEKRQELISSSKTKIYDSFDSLYQLILKDLQIPRKI